MYFVNRSEIEQTIAYLDILLNEMDRSHPPISMVEKLSTERLTHVVIEIILDVGNLMIDGFIMRDPGSYHDIIDILIDERVLPAKDEIAYKELIDLRQMLVNEYLTINHHRIFEVFSKHLHAFKQFSSYIQLYLSNELGVANAFS